MRQLFALAAGTWERMWEALSPLLAPVALGVGTWAISALRSRRKRLEAQSAARAHDRALIYALAEIAQITLDEARWRDWVTSTGRQHPLDEGELARRSGSFYQRRKDAGEMLWKLLGNDSKREPQPDTRPQDMFDDEEADKR